nr:hypothetical protein [Brevibacillus reuszeri]
MAAVMEDVVDLDAVVAVVAVAVARAVVHAAAHAAAHAVARAVVLAAASVPAHAVALSSFRYPTVVIRIIEKISLQYKAPVKRYKSDRSFAFFCWNDGQRANHRMSVTHTTQVVEDSR